MAAQIGEGRLKENEDSVNSMLESPVHHSHIGGFNILGGLLIFVLLVTPASIADQFCFNVKSMFVVAPAMALIVSTAGVWAGFEYILPIAPLVALMLTAVFAASILLSFKRRINISLH